MPRRPRYLFVLAIGLALVVAACGGAETEAEDSSNTTNQTTTSTEPSEADSATDTTATGATSGGVTATGANTLTFTAEVWADNWFALYANGELVGEDSVSITTERSFNAEIISFEASYPLTLALEAKDYIETDSGLEYIGEANQQMGDGGIIAQITDETTGEVVAVTSSAWAALVVHQAPLNAGCVDDADPDATCEYLITDTPSDWTSPEYDDSAWTSATEWSSAAVDPKGGYDEIDWDSSAQFIWGTDLEVDNTVLLRSTVAGP